MQIVQTIELTDEERITVSKFLKLADTISDVARCSMDDVFVYFADKAEIIEENNAYSIGAIHQITDIK